MNLTWAHRDRIVQQDQLVAHDEASIGPESGTTYRVRIYRADIATPVRTVTGITTASFTYTAAMAAADSIGSAVWVELDAIRGGLVSHSVYRFRATYEGSGYGLSGYGDAYGV